MNLGRWTTAQIFYHLAGAIEGSLEGLPQGYSLVVRLLVRPLRHLVTSIRFPPWLPIPQAIRFKLDPPSDAELMAQYERLMKAIDRFQSFQEEHPPHPVLGKLSRAEWIAFHQQHCRHHLSFIRLTKASPNTDP